TCCRTDKHGKTRCSIKHATAACKAPHGGTACSDSHASCCEACSVGCDVAPNTKCTDCANPALGDARACTLFALDGAAVEMTGKSRVAGSACVGANGALTMTGGAR